MSHYDYYEERPNYDNEIWYHDVLDAYSEYAQNVSENRQYQMSIMALSYK